MQARSVIVMVLGVVIALATAMALKNRGAQQAPALTQVLVAAADIPAGSFIRSDVMLTFADWPRDNITPVMITNEQAKASDFSGAVARRTISKGEAIIKNLLVKSNEGGFMSAVLEPGKRAVSIAVDSTTGNAGFIFPGDRVDVILTHTIGGQGSEERASETFIEDARVLAVDQMIDNPENKAVLAKTVTLEVTPKQAEEINLAKDLGKISLSLRSMAKLKNVPVPDAAATAPQTLDDVLREELPGGSADGSENGVTRDTDVSKILTRSPGSARVRVLRGTAQAEDLMFGPGGTTTNPNGTPNGAPVVR